jgi:hypothetical protein
MNSKDKNALRQPKRSKNAARVDRQLEALNAASAEGANVTEVASTTEEAVKDATEAGDSTGPQTEFTRGQFGKAKRAFAKANEMTARPISKRINKPENNDPSVLEAGEMEHVGRLI